MEKRLRCRALRSPVTVSLDGENFAAEAGEPLAVALYGHGIRAWSRSPKFHRPRGPACFRGSCEGCLLRVNGVPNVMSCLVPAEEGQVLETQNTLGTRDIDLLIMADWLFPHGVNHHELFAGVPVLQDVMQNLARRVVGLGVLPSEGAASKSGPARPAIRRHVPILIVGGGAAGMAAATAFARHGLEVELVEESSGAGGSLRALSPAARQRFAALEAAFGEVCEAGRVTVRPRTLAAAIFPTDPADERKTPPERSVLLVSDRAELVTSDTLVLATGTHDAMPAFPGNDVPGVLPLRAAGWLLAHGVLPGRKPLFLVPHTDHVFAAEAGELAASCSGTVVFGEVERVHGTSHVSAVSVVTSGKVQKFGCDALVVCAPRSPAYELALQCGATVQHEDRGFRVCTQAGSTIAPGAFATGSLIGQAHDPAGYVLTATNIVRAALG
ncbi:MAG: (2Fe-2S)-binding protein [Polyangiaceae bacterium]